MPQSKTQWNAETPRRRVKRGDNHLGRILRVCLRASASPRSICLLLLMALASAMPARAADTLALATATADKGLAYLKSQQKPDNSWQDEADPPGVSALVLKSFMEDERYDADMPYLDKGFDKLLSYQVADGGIYKDLLANYNTAIAISALAVSKEAEYKPAIVKALAYLRSLQWSDKIEGVDEKMKVEASDPKYGGFGYGKRGRPDLSNTQWAIEALAEAGVKPTDPAFQAALKFATRCQNLSETNDQKWAGDDGGFVYLDSGATGGDPAGEYTGPDGRLMFRSYGSMTYAGLKSMIYAGLGHDDPRVKAAWGWIERNYTVDENPGLAETGPENAKGGLFYYFYTMAKALHAYGEPIITDAQGKQHDWRADLTAKIASLQRPDGSLVGQAKWMESNPVLVTSYAMLAIEEVRKDLRDHPGK
jgi:prenyltransferase/squalene oxidase-like repeat protein